jgi:hypothetical protein
MREQVFMRQDGGPTDPFHSFWMGGFEGADHVNGSGLQLQINCVNGHWRRLREDYTALRALGIHTVRESIGWRLFEAGGAESRRRLLAQAALAAELDMQVVWSLMHYGVPAGLDLFDERMPEAFAGFCKEIAILLHGLGRPPPVYQPVNEISFLSWAASATGLIHPHVPSSSSDGGAVKRNLVRAALLGTEAIWSVAPQARILHTDPLVHVTAPPGADEAAQQLAKLRHEDQFEALDMVSGRRCPELGGSPRHLDLIGLNYYHANQWEYGTGTPLHWHLRDARRRPADALIADIWQRYRRPIVIAETGHFGEGRAQWLDEIAASALACGARGIPLLGICLYPVLDRPDWENPLHWHRSGLWDLPHALAGDLTRVLDEPFAARVQHWTSALPHAAA